GPRRGAAGPRRGAGQGLGSRLHAQRDALPHGREDRPGALPPPGGRGARHRRPPGRAVRADVAHRPAPPRRRRRGQRAREGGRPMSLATSYLGFELPHPLVPGASPLAEDLDTVRRLEDAGAPMITMYSLFEEQIVREELSLTASIETPKECYAEALSYFP